MSYIPHTEQDVREMLAVIGKESVDQLFSAVPSELLLKEPPDINHALSEPEIRDFFSDLAAKNTAYKRSFAGAGSYRHYIPSATTALISQGAFSTAYTPYQAEASQGTLQAIFEFQTYIAMLTGTDVANASLYDGASALAEAVGLARADRKKDKVLISDTVHPEYIETVATYYGSDVILPLHNAQGVVDLAAAEEQLQKGVAALVIQSPNFFGAIEDIESLAQLAHKYSALLIVVINELYSAVLLKRAGECGADIVVGDAQAFGSPTAFGGPTLGFMGVKSKFMRKIPGRLCGITQDSQGNECYVLTLQAREQHIRREKSSSNICSNQALCALAATITLSLLGKDGVYTAASSSMKSAHYLANALSLIPGMQLKFNADFFNEFVLDCGECSPDLILEKLSEAGILGGVALKRFNKEYENLLLIYTSELIDKQDIDRYVEIVRACAGGEG